MLALKHRNNDAGNFEMPEKTVPYRESEGLPFIQYHLRTVNFVISCGCSSLTVPNL